METRTRLLRTAAVALCAASLSAPAFARRDAGSPAPITARLMTALARIVPGERTLVIDPGVDPATVVTWRPRRHNWRLTLDDALTDAKLAVLVNPMTGTVRVFPSLGGAGAAASSASSAVPAQPVHGSETGGGGPSPAVAGGIPAHPSVSGPPASSASGAIPATGAWRAAIAAGRANNFLVAVGLVAPVGTGINLAASAPPRAVYAWPAGTRAASLRALLAGSGLSVHFCHGTLELARSVRSAVPCSTGPAGKSAVPAKKVEAVGPLAKVPHPMPAHPLFEEWSIERGQSMRVAISGWARRDGWTVEWYADDWRAPVAVHITAKSFLQAAHEWTQSAVSNGAPIRVEARTGNRVLVVESTVRNQNGF